MQSDRYGTINRKINWKLTGIILTLIAIAAVSVGYFIINPKTQLPVTGQMQGYKFINKNDMQLRFFVTRKDPEKAASCILIAQDKLQDDVGRREILIKPSQTDGNTYITEIPTFKPGYTATVYGCSYTVPEYMRS